MDGFIQARKLYIGLIESALFLYLRMTKRVEEVKYVWKPHSAMILNYLHYI